MRNASFLFVFFLLGNALAAQQAAERPPEKCSIEGQVVKAATGEPLKKAWIVLRKAEGRSEPKTATTGANGRFKLDEIEPGRYRLFATRNGYVRQEYGQRDPNRPGTILTLSPGQTVRDVDFRLIPAAVIAGRVYDEDGEPMLNVMVQALRFRYVRGERQLRPTQIIRTNDLGEFRLFGLPPGEYYVSATFTSMFMQGLRGVGLVRSGRQGGDESYAPTYYPGTNDASQASAIRVKAGNEIRGVDFTLLPTRTVRVRGRVFNSVTGKPGRGVSIRLVPRKSGLVGFFRNSAEAREPDGAFEIRGVTPGAYVMTARWQDGDQNYSTRLPLEVAGQDVEGVELVITQGVDVLGEVRIEGTAAGGINRPTAGKNTAEPKLEDTRIFLFPKEEVLLFGQQSARVGGDGIFTVKNVSAGDYRINVWRLPEDYYIKSARLAGEDVLEEGLAVTGGGLPDRLEIVVSAAGARIDGAVLNAEGRPYSGARVVLAPDQSRRHRRDRFKSAVSDQNGRFVLRGIAPGEHKLFAWEEVEQGAWLDAEFLRPYEERGHTVRVEEGARLALELELIPADEPR